MARSLSKKRRFEVFKRDAFACQYCGRTPPSAVLEVDHIHPVSDGGTDDENNLITSCFDCNRGKSDTPLGQIIPTVAEKMVVARERAEQAKEYSDFLASLRLDEDATIDRLGVEFNNYWQTKSNRNKYTFGIERAASVRRFLKDLTETEIREAIEIACTRKSTEWQAWKYFCGICWNKIKE